MSFVSEHYNTLFRALVRGGQEEGSGQVTPKSSEAQSDLVESSDIGSKLAKRAFDLSTQLLATPTSKAQQFAAELSPLQNSSGVGSVNQGEYGVSNVNRNYANVPCPTLDSVVSDLRLISGLFENDQDSALALLQEKQDARIVLLSSVAALHAYTISNLLESTLPLSADMEYWSAQENSALSVALYFVQSLPRRMYTWIVYTICALLEQPAANGRDILDRLYLAMPNTLLFPNLGAVASGNIGAQSKHTGIALLRIPTKVNIMSLTRREIRYNQTQIAELQERLAISIGMLSQVSLVPGDANSSDVCRKTTPEALLQQIDVILSNLHASSTASGSLDCNDFTSMVQATESLVSRVQSIPLIVEDCIQNHRKPSLLSRCWLSAALVILCAKYASSYIYGHEESLREWIASGLVTVQNYVIQYILQPLRSGYETIRYGKHTYNVVTQASLESDFRSLESMVLAFSERLGTIDPAEVRLRVERGDLSDVMQVYAQEMQKPFRSALFGDLVQAILIQIQKVKVDVGQTMAALDKLLKSNELNFLLLSTVPATLTVYAAVNWISGSLSWLMGGRKCNTITSIQLVVRDIDRLLNNSSGGPRSQPFSGVSEQTSAATHGRLICLTHYLRHHAKHIPNSATLGRMRTGAGWCYVLPHSRALFIEDVRDIESVFLTTNQKRNVVDRMYRIFRFL
ncbi:Nuclear control of ATPase protein 2 [Coemansia sp. RSA 1933]|nr:Nuclear control of ATPase protein 2 [Coemansia sp. RSA 1933]